MDSTMVAALSAAVGFAAKALWDLFYARKREIESLALTKRVELLDRQLSEFYWPLYIRLEKDNVVWKRILDIGDQDEKKRRIAQEIERGVILPNHGEIVGIIESRMHLAQADPKLTLTLLQYIHHVTLHKALREAGENRVFPMDIGVEWPYELCPMIKERIQDLQREYDLLIGRQSRLNRGMFIPAAAQLAGQPPDRRPSAMDDEPIGARADNPRGTAESEGWREGRPHP